MPASLFDNARTFGVDAERLIDAEFFLRRLWDNMAADVRDIMLVGCTEPGCRWSKDVCRGSRRGSITGSSIFSETDAMANCFIPDGSFGSISEVGWIRDRYRSFTLRVFPAAMK